MKDEKIDTSTFKVARCPIHKKQAMMLIRVRIIRTGAFVNRYWCSRCKDMYIEPGWEEIKTGALELAARYGRLVNNRTDSKEPR